MSMLKYMITLCTLGLSFAATTTSQAGDVLQVNPGQREALGIVVGKVQPRKLVPRTRLPGRITLPNSRVRLITVRSSAVLLSPLVEVGDSVITGQELARLESPAFVSLQRVYLQALSELDLARATASREKQLAKEGIIAGRRAAESNALLRDARSRLEEQRQALLLSGMTDKEISHLAKTHHLNPAVVLRAARSGVVLEQYARAGERLEAGGLLYRIGDLDALTVEIHTPLDIAHLLRKGTRFSLPDEDALGQVISVGGEVHSRDQGVLVRGEIQHGVARLRPGQFVRVQFETARDGGAAFALPSTAVVHAHDHAWLFLEAEGGFEPIRVEVVGGSGRESIVVGSLTEESRIALRGTAALKAHWLAQGGPEQ
jgi:multidrug efflux pump subunit AcrA (membrane-fusion protein)